MILEAVVCPDCGELTVRNIQIDEFGTPVWACQKCGVVHEDRSWYRCISQKEAEDIINTREPRGLFLLDTGIDIRMKRIYVDMADGSVYLSYLPINVRCYSDPMYLEDDLRKDLSYMIRTMPNLQGSGSRIIEQMLDEPACSFASIMASIRQSLSMSTGTGY